MEEVVKARGLSSLSDAHRFRVAPALLRVFPSFPPIWAVESSVSLGSERWMVNTVLDKSHKRLLDPASGKVPKHALEVAFVRWEP
jgi:hypothetical protein